jgi:hypothetical protein
MKLLERFQKKMTFARRELLPNILWNKKMTPFWWNPKGSKAAREAIPVSIKFASGGSREEGKQG